MPSITPNTPVKATANQINKASAIKLNIPQSYTHPLLSQYIYSHPVNML
jgi:hypothetical protein